MGRALAWLALIALLSLTALWLREQIAAANDRVAYPARGELIEVGDHAMHLYCTGPRDDRPTIVMDSGMGGWSELWPLQQDALSSNLRVCSYDRSGYGWSEAGPGPRNVRTLARELHELLGASSEEGPYVLVGSSFGGLVVRMYEELYPTEVAGMVLLDPADEDALERLPRQYADTERQAPGFDRRIKPLLAELGIDRWSHNQAPPFIPADRRAPLMAAARQPKQLRAQLAEEDAWTETDQMMREIGGLGDTPLIVLSATEGGDPGVIAGRHLLHRELVASSTRGEHRIVPGLEHASFLHNSDHGRIVNQAIRDMVERVGEGGVE